MPEKELNTKARDALVSLAKALVDQDAASVLVEPQQNADGFWFGSGNLIEPEPGRYLLCGRYRNHGDSRTGTRAGGRDIRGHYTDRAVHEDSVIYKTGFVAPGSAGGFD